MPSKFISLIKDYVKTPEQYRFKLEPLPVEMSISEKIVNIPFNKDLRYTIGISWERHVYAQSKDIATFKDLILKELNHDIYGEFIKDLLNVRYMIIAGEYIIAKEKLDKIIKEIADV